MLVEDEAASRWNCKRPVKGHIYSIRIKGHLDQGWSEWLGGLTISHEEDGTTVLTGPVSDPPAMYGLLIKLRDLGLSLISINLCQSNREEPAKGQAGNDDPEQDSS